MVIGNMKRDIKNIIKRIIVGVGIALILSFINSCQVNATSHIPNWTGYQLQSCNEDWCAKSWHTDLSGHFAGGIFFQAAFLKGNNGIRFYDDYVAYQSKYLLSGYVYVPRLSTTVEVYTKEQSCAITMANSSADTDIANQSFSGYVYRFDCIGTSDYDYIGVQTDETDSNEFIGVSTTVWITDLTDGDILSALNIQIQEQRITYAHIDSRAQDIINAIRNTDVGVLKDTMDSIDANQKETNKKMDQLNDNITNSDTSDASSSADSFFSGFESNDYGLSSIITAPLNLIKSITSSTCKPLGFKAPFVEQNVTLPCMSAIYKEFFGSFLTLYQTITFGIVSYWVSVKIFFMVKGFKDPDSDKIEVLDL